MSEPFFDYTHMNESGRSSLSFAGTESKRGCHVPERARGFQPVHRPSHTPSTVPLEFQSRVLPPNNWRADTPVYPYRSVTAAQIDFPPFPPQPTLRRASPSLHASSTSPLFSGYSASSLAHPLISERDLQRVAMPTMTGHPQYGGNLIDAHTCHYDPSFGYTHDDYMVGYPRAVPFITMPIDPTFICAGHMDPILPSGPIPRWSPPHPTPIFQHSFLPESNLSLSPSGSFDSGSFSSPSPPFSMESYSLVASPSETLDQIQPQPTIIASVNQPYALTVPLEHVEFPLIPSVEDTPFFQCHWNNCGIWITSDKEAVEYHLTHTHGVVPKGGSAGLARCGVAGCSSSVQRNGLVRHFRSHLGLKWLCSLCGRAYARDDSVGLHARKESRCQLAQAIGHPSAVAYRARANGNNTVTLTKVVQP